MDAVLRRVNGQTEGAGDARLKAAMAAGMAEGLSRAEMRARIERQAREIEALRAEAQALEARARELAGRCRAAEAESRIKSALIHADKSGRLAAIERRWAHERRRTAERIVNAALPYIWILAALAILIIQLRQMAGV